MKIAVIGGAGVRTVIFINGLLKRYKKLHIDEVVLYDIQEEKQRIIEKLCKHVVERNHEELKVWAVSDPVEAITGADYIVTTLRVGGDHSRVVDETIALDLGVIGQETTGVGGFSMAVRTIPVLIEYCELIKKYAPDAWIFNFTNPSGLVTQALRSAGYDKIIGICDAPSSTKFRMARDLGVEEDDLCHRKDRDGKRSGPQRFIRETGQSRSRRLLKHQRRPHRRGRGPETRALLSSFHERDTNPGRLHPSQRRR